MEAMYNLFEGDPTMILTKELAFFKAKEEFQNMIELAKQAANNGVLIHEVETDLWEGLLKMGRYMLQGYVAAQGTGDIGATLEYEGQALNRLEGLFDRRYVSIFGELLIPRTVYGTRLTQKFEIIPLDARLGLPESDFSYVLQGWDQSFCVQNSFDASRHNIQRIMGLGQTLGSLEQMNRSMADDVEAFYAAQPVPPPEQEASILVLTADGKGVPMRRDPKQDAPAPSGRLKKGQKAGKKREACVGGVYTVEPFVRTVEDVVNEVLRKKSKEKRPVPKNKQLRAALTQEIDGQEVKGKEQIFSWFAEQVETRNKDGIKPIVCVMDGARSLWKMLARHVVGVICILDIYHALEYLWDASYCFFPEGSDEAEAFVTERLKRILEGKIGYVIGGLKQMATKGNLTKAKRAQLTRVLTYFKNNQRFMRYDDYLANGYPIGSGVVEGACRHLVKDRMEGTGMRWCVAGAQAMLNLRAVFLNDDWETFQQYRIELNCQKLYPYQNKLELNWNEAA
jgi:hypothetical protein